MNIKNKVEVSHGNGSANKRLESLWLSKRLYIMLLLFFASLINYIDRVSMSIAVPSISTEFNWDAGTMGIILSSLFWAYAFCLIPMGWLTDKIGARKLNTWALSLWSGATICVGASGGFVTMLISMLGLGAGESATVPIGSKVVRQWFSVKERGLATALARSGAEAGPAIGMPLVACLVLTYGWRISFVVTGVLGFIWLFFWVKYFRNSPQECSWLPEEEKTFILSNTDGNDQATNNIPPNIIWRLLQTKTMWGLALSQGCIMYTQYLILTWLPAYLMQVRHMALMNASLFSSFAFVIAWILGIAVCKLSDMVLTPEKVLQGRRRIMVITFMVLCSIFIFTSFAENPILIFVIITLVKTFLASAIGLNMTLANDVVANPSVVGNAFGILLFGGNFFGAMAPIVTGYIVKSTGSFDSAFLLAGILIIIGALISYTMTRKPIEIE